MDQCVKQVMKEKQAAAALKIQVSLAQSLTCILNSCSLQVMLLYFGHDKHCEVVSHCVWIV